MSGPVTNSFNVRFPTSQLPNPRVKGAPRFRGKNLLRFLADYETAAAEGHWTELEKCTRLVGYCDSNTQDLIEDVPSYRQGDWKGLVKQLKLYYVADDKSDKYTIDGLDRFTKKKRSIQNKKEFLEYYREFCRRAGPVKDELGSTTTNRYFWSGMPLTLRSDITGELMKREPGHSSKKPRPIEEIRKIAVYLLDENVMYQIRDSERLKGLIKGELRGKTSVPKKEKKAKKKSKAKRRKTYSSDESESEEDSENDSEDSDKDTTDQSSEDEDYSDSDGREFYDPEDSDSATRRKGKKVSFRAHYGRTGKTSKSKEGVSGKAFEKARRINEKMRERDPVDVLTESMGNLNLQSILRILEEEQTKTTEKREFNRNAPAAKPSMGHMMLLLNKLVEEESANRQDIQKLLDQKEIMEKITRQSSASPGPTSRNSREQSRMCWVCGQTGTHPVAPRSCPDALQAEKEGLIKFDDRGRPMMYNGNRPPFATQGESILPTLRRMNGPARTVGILQYSDDEDSEEEEDYQDPDVFMNQDDGNDSDYWGAYGAERFDKNAAPRTNMMGGDQQRAAWKDQKKPQGREHRGFDIILPAPRHNYAPREGAPIAPKQYQAAGGNVPSLGSIARIPPMDAPKVQDATVHQGNNNKTYQQEPAKETPRAPVPRIVLPKVQETATGAPGRTSAERPAPYEKMDIDSNPKPRQDARTHQPLQGKENRQDARTFPPPPNKEYQPSKWKNMSKEDFEIAPGKPAYQRNYNEKGDTTGKNSLTTIIRSQHDSEEILKKVMSTTTIVLPLEQFLAVCPEMEKKVSNETRLRKIIPNPQEETTIRLMKYDDEESEEDEGAYVGFMFQSLSEMDNKKEEETLPEEPTDTTGDALTSEGEAPAKRTFAWRAGRRNPGRVRIGQQVSDTEGFRRNRMAAPSGYIRASIEGHPVILIPDTGAEVGLVGTRVSNILMNYHAVDTQGARSNIKGISGKVANTTGCFHNVPVLMGGKTFLQTLFICSDLDSTGYDVIMGMPGLIASAGEISCSKDGTQEIRMYEDGDKTRPPVVQTMQHDRIRPRPTVRMVQAETEEEENLGHQQRQEEREPVLPTEGREDGFLRKPIVRVLANFIESAFGGRSWNPWKLKVTEDDGYAGSLLVGEGMARINGRRVVSAVCPEEEYNVITKAAQEYLGLKVQQLTRAEGDPRTPFEEYCPDVPVKVYMQDWSQPSDSPHYAYAEEVRDTFLVTQGPLPGYRDITLGDPWISRLATTGRVVRVEKRKGNGERPEPLDYAEPRYSANFTIKGEGIERYLIEGRPYETSRPDFDEEAQLDYYEAPVAYDLADHERNRKSELIFPWPLMPCAGTTCKMWNDEGTEYGEYRYYPENVANQWKEEAKPCLIRGKRARRVFVPLSHVSPIILDDRHIHKTLDRLKFEQLGKNVEERIKRAFAWPYEWAIGERPLTHATERRRVPRIGWDDREALDHDFRQWNENQTLFGLYRFTRDDHIQENDPDYAEDIRNGGIKKAYRRRFEPDEYQPPKPREVLEGENDGLQTVEEMGLPDEFNPGRSVMIAQYEFDSDDEWIQVEQESGSEDDDYTDASYRPPATRKRIPNPVKLSTPPLTRSRARRTQESLRDEMEVEDSLETDSDPEVETPPPSVDNYNQKEEEEEPADYAIKVKYEETLKEESEASASRQNQDDRRRPKTKKEPTQEWKAPSLGPYLPPLN